MSSSGRRHVWQCESERSSSSISEHYQYQVSQVRPSLRGRSGEGGVEIEDHIFGRRYLCLKKENKKLGNIFWQEGTALTPLGKPSESVRKFRFLDIVYIGG